MEQSLEQQIDSDHEVIYQKITLLYEYCHSRNASLDCAHCSSSATAKATCREHVISQLCDISKEITDHFVSEENHLGALPIENDQKPIIFAHKKDHDKIVEKVGDLLSKSGEAATSDIVKSLVLDLLSTFEHHVNTHDKKLISIIASDGE